MADLRRAIETLNDTEAATAVARARLGDDEGLVRLAWSLGKDKACAALLAAGQGGVTAVSFEDLAAAGMAEAALAFARRECKAAGLTLCDAADEDGNGYLHLAAAAGGPANLLVLLAREGCSVAQLNDSGEAPLHIAAAAGHLGAVKGLLEAGADAQARNGKGRTARGQPGVSGELREVLAEAEEASKRRRAEQQAALWDDKMKATQTASACRMGCV